MSAFDENDWWIATFRADGTILAACECHPFDPLDEDDPDEEDYDLNFPPFRCPSCGRMCNRQECAELYLLPLVDPEEES